MKLYYVYFPLRQFPSHRALVKKKKKKTKENFGKEENTHSTPNSASGVFSASL